MHDLAHIWLWFWHCFCIHYKSLFIHLIITVYTSLFFSAYNFLMLQRMSMMDEGNIKIAEHTRRICTCMHCQPDSLLSLKFTCFIQLVTVNQVYFFCLDFSHVRQTYCWIFVACIKQNMNCLILNIIKYEWKPKMISQLKRFTHWQKLYVTALLWGK
jgi:hypothetical protein